MRHICKECGGTVFYQTVLIHINRFVDGDLEHLSFIDGSESLYNDDDFYYCNNCDTRLGDDDDIDTDDDELEV